MDFPDIEVLDACREVQVRQAEMLPRLASALGMPDAQVFYAWSMRVFRQRGELAGGQWTYFFHGRECDLNNRADGRHLRIDFGPGGRLDTFSGWGVLTFVMTSVAPWAEYPALKKFFATTAPPSEYNTGDAARFGEVWDRLKERGCFEAVRPDLMAFEAQHTSLGPDGIRVISLPIDTPEELQADIGVAHRLILSAKGLQLLGEAAVDSASFYRQGW